MKKQFLFPGLLPAAMPLLALLCLLLTVGPVAQAQTSPASFTYTGDVQSFTVPAGITSLIVVANGAQGEW